MQREGRACGGAHDGMTITCEEYGFTPTTERIWWIPTTKELFSYEDGIFHPYEGPVIHGTGYTF